MKKISIIIALALIAINGSAQIMAQKASEYGWTADNFKWEHIQSSKPALDLAFDYNFADMKLRSNRFVALTPVLLTKNKEHVATFAPVVVAGRRQYVMYERKGYVDPNYEGAPVYKLKEARKNSPISYDDQTAWREWMEGAYLYFVEDVCGCCALKDSALIGPFLRIPRDPARYMQYAPLKDIEKVYTLHGTAYVNFIVDKTNIEPFYMNNPRELRKITDTLDIMVADPNITVDRVMIHGYASPESPYSHNTYLASTRAQSLTDYVAYCYKLPRSVFAPAEYTSENWGDLRDAVAQTEMDNKAAILALIDEAIAVPEAQGAKCDEIEKRIKTTYPEQYRWMLSTIYPHLRRSDYEVTFTVKKFASDEARDILRSNPGYLNAEELATLAGLYPKDSDEYANVFAVAEKNIAVLEDQNNIDNANLTMAVAALKQSDLATAEQWLNRCNGSPEANNARGVYYVLGGDYANARRLLQSSADEGCEAAVANLAWLDDELDF